MKIRYKIALGLLTAFLIWLILIQFQTYSYPQKNNILQRVNYLERVINEPLGNGSEISEIGNESYEWMLFSYSFSSYALTNIAIRDSSFKDRSSQIIKTAIERVLEEPIFSPYGVEYIELFSDSIPDYSVLYLGHLNLMLGNYRMLSSDTTYNRLNDNISRSLYRRYSETEFLNLESYPTSIWIPDNTVAIASLKLHSFNTNSTYESIAKQWIEYAKITISIIKLACYTQQ